MTDCNTNHNPSGEDRRYNGWANYETWYVHLWLSNDQVSYEVSLETVTAAPDLVTAAENLRNWVEEMNPIADQASLYVDLLNAALREVDWYEIAAAFQDESE